MNPQPAAQPSPFAEMLATDPFPLYANFRQIAPVTKIEAIGLWLILKYDDVVRALRDPETFSSVVGATEIAGEALPPTMLFNDPPVHTRMRSLVQKAFTPRVVELQRAAIQERADALIAAMLEHEVVDVVEELAYPLPITVIAKMLGVEDGDMPTFKRWSDDILDNIIPIVMTGDDTGLASTNVEFDAYFHEQLERYRRHPEENLLSELIHVETDEGHLSEEELLMFCRLLLVAGNETTTGLIVNAIRAFAEFPDALTRLRGDMSLLPSAIEETLRFYAPFQAVFRRVTRDVELRGRDDPRGRPLPRDARLGQPRRRGVRASQRVRDRPRPEPPRLVRDGHPLLPRRAARAAGGGHRPAHADPAHHPGRARRLSPRRPLPPRRPEELHRAAHAGVSGAHRSRHGQDCERRSSNKGLTCDPPSTKILVAGFLVGTANSRWDRPAVPEVEEMETHKLRVVAARRVNHPVILGVDKHYFTVRAKDIPSGISSDPNAREPLGMNRQVYRDVRDSLFARTSQPGSFDLMNKGITILATAVRRIDDEIYEVDVAPGQGIVDGGHTYQIILNAQDDPNLPDEQHVEVQVRTGIGGELVTDIARGLNTSIQVQKQVSRISTGHSLDEGPTSDRRPDRPDRVARRR